MNVIIQLAQPHSRALSTTLYSKSIQNRVAKCYGYDGYGRTHNLAKSSLFCRKICLTTAACCHLGQPCKRDACLAPLFKVLLSNVPLSSRNPGPKKGTDNFCIGGANLQLGSGDGGVSLWTSGCQDCLVSLNRQTILSG